MPNDFAWIQDLDTESGLYQCRWCAEIAVGCPGYFVASHIDDIDGIQGKALMR